MHTRTSKRVGFRCQSCWKGFSKPSHSVSVLLYTSQIPHTTTKIPHMPSSYHNFYQKRATLDDSFQDGEMSVPQDNIIRNYKAFQEMQMQQEGAAPAEANASHSNQDDGTQNSNQNQDPMQDDEQHDMGLSSVLSAIKERKTGAPPKIPSMPSAPSFPTKGTTSTATTTTSSTFQQYIQSRGFPPMIENSRLGRKPKTQSPHQKETSQKERLKQEHQKILEENMQLQRNLEKQQEEARRKRQEENATMMMAMEDDHLPENRFGSMNPMPPTQKEETIQEAKQAAHKKNMDTLKNMSADEVKKLKEDLLSKLDPNLVAKLQERASARQRRETLSFQQEKQKQREAHSKSQPLTEEEKLEWTKNVDATQPAESNEMRYDMEGRPVLEEPKEYDRVLYHHGVDQHKAGYTLSEICYLCRSIVPGQKVINFDLLTKIIRHQLREDPQKYFTDMFYALLDDFQLPMIIMFALKEKNVNVIQSALSTLVAFIHFEHNEKWLDAFEKYSIAGLIGAPLMCPPQKSQEDEDPIIEEASKLKNVTGTAKGDLLKAFVDMDILEVLHRICSQLDDYASSEHIPRNIVKILSTLVLHSHSLAYSVLEKVLLRSIGESSSKMASQKTILARLLLSTSPACANETLQLLKWCMRYSSNDTKSVLKEHQFIVLDAQVSLAALAAGDWSKLDIFKRQVSLLRMFIGKGHVLQQFCADNFQYISPLLRQIFEAKATKEQLDLVADLFDLLEAYCRSNPNDQICHLRIFAESDCILMVRHLYQRVWKASPQTDSSLFFTHLHLLSRIFHFYASFYSSIVRCTAHKKHTVDSIERVVRAFASPASDADSDCGHLSLIDMMKDCFTRISAHQSLSEWTIPAGFQSQIEYPENLSMYPINLSPHVSSMNCLDALTSILRLSFFLVEGFPPMRTHIAQPWLAPQLNAMKEQYLQLVKQTAPLYERNRFIMKYSNLAVSEFGGLLLDIHFLLHGHADRSCHDRPETEMTFFLILAFTSVSMTVYVESVRRICYGQYPKVEEQARKAGDNMADWFFAALEKEYLQHGVSKSVDTSLLTQTVSLLNTIETHAPLYASLFLSPLIRFANMIKVLLICGTGELHEDDSLCKELNVYIERYYSLHFEHHAGDGSVKQLITNVDTQDFLSNLSQELINAYCNASFNHPTFAAFVCVFLDSVWPLSIQKQVLKQVDIFRSIQLNDEIAKFFAEPQQGETSTLKAVSGSSFDAQYVDYVLHEFTGLVGCGDRSNPLYKYFTRRLSKLLQSSAFYQEQYREDLEDNPRLLRDLHLDTESQ